MIRDYKSADLPILLELWLESTISGHSFIDESYWLQVKQMVAERYLPMAKTAVYEEKNEIIGFISLLENRLIGALFVRPSHQSLGVGKALIHWAKAQHTLLLLEVYPQNQRAYQFYQYMGFTVLSESFNEETGATVATMCYQAV